MKTAVQLGYTGELLEQIRLGGELHDIGKIGTREAVLNKPGPLTPDEFEHIKEHTALGERILAPFLARVADRAADRPLASRADGRERLSRRAQGRRDSASRRASSRWWTRSTP